MAMPAPQLGHFGLPRTLNEPMRNYEPKSSDRAGLQAAVDSMLASAPFDVPLIINGQAVQSGKTAQQLNPSNHSQALCRYQEADANLTRKAIDGALAAKKDWEAMPFADRAAIFLKAADLIAGKYRFPLMAATMLGQGKNVWQAEIDAAAETCDFLRFGVKFVDELYKVQPSEHAKGMYNRMEYRALEGFIFAISPFNFTAIAANLVGVPTLVGNVAVWKPSPMAIYSNYLIYKIFEEAGMPPGVIQFVPGPAEEIATAAIEHKFFAGLHFTGSTHVFRHLWKQIASNMDKYTGYPRIVGETGGKNFHLVHPSADVDTAVHQAVRGAFEYQGQKCSALSRLYVPQSLWSKPGGFKEKLLASLQSISQGPVEDFKHFMGPVIAKHSFDKIISLIEAAKKDGGKIIAGGTGDDSKGFYVKPTVIETTDPRSVTMINEIFGPVVTIYAYPDNEFEETCHLIDTTTEYALTGSIFAQDRSAVVKATNLLRNSSGMFYINGKCTGAVVGQQPFGGARASGTNDKAGSMQVFLRFVSARTISESFLPIDTHLYPSNLV
ncbi:putative delta-1-pyrroline-5-carboxylate dehydrogenase [Ceraceosorus guamensis]|uniref:Multifunctional fusion protein n=1 Tax=Ceraceosorus guamensis TaxID=1522189 RepID=A0A316VV58_9BASI|nr:putative delta-1-pyrroline-5-carboxylate dehydrogenase [Ceraceosorus guamensis]PWN41507.1 putative delta-1-pyrroline-5-carboxylate dehydrogenase [Ceraceosorus guamensis]